MIAWPDVAGDDDQGTTSFPPGRDYTIGCPVGITLNHDGSVSVVVYLGEAGESVADDFDPDNPNEDCRAADALLIMAAIDAGHVTATYSKGA